MENKEKVINIIRNIASKMKDPEHVKQICSEERNHIILNDKSINQWDELSLINGYPSLCILFGELNKLFPNEEWDLVGHKYMIKIQESIEKNGIKAISLFSGACGIGMAAYSLSCNKERYMTFLRTINEYIIKNIYSMLKFIKVQTTGTIMSIYDVMQGFSGIGRYLLLFKDDPRIKNIIENILKYLVSLTEDINVFNHSVPKFYIERENQFLESEKKLYARGNFNLGMSHGISGPLAFMSISLLNDVEVKGQKDAIRKIVSIMNTFKYDVNGTIYWPGRVSFEAFIEKKKKNVRERASWCYGVPGMARAIYLAGKALNNNEYKDLSIESLDKLCSLKEELLYLKSPSFCHGYAGLLEVLNSLYKENSIESFKEYRNKILNKILSLYDKEAPLGFYNIDISNYGTLTDLKKFDNCGLLTGTTGIVLTILDTILPGKIQWDSTFMLN